MRVRINNNQPTATQRKALKQECVKEFDKLLSLYNRQVALQVLYILRFDYGFGQKRLERFSDALGEMQIRTLDRYDATDGEVADICEIKLRESGIDIKKILERQ